MARQTPSRLAWLLCISIAVTACKDEPEIIDTVRAIKTITVSDQAGSKILKFPGVAAAVDSSDLSFQVGGQVESVGVDIGDQVKKGQVLAFLDPEPYRLEVDSIKAELVKAKDHVTQSKAQYERHKRIYEQGAGAKSYLDVAEYDYKAALSAVVYQEARLELAERDLRKTKLLSPYDGTIAWRSVEPHEEVHVGQKVLVVDAAGDMEVALAVPETTVDLIRVGDEATIAFPTLPGETAKGRISYIGSAAFSANAFPVKVELTDPNEKTKPGMTAEVNLTIVNENPEPGFKVPFQAILPDHEANRGFVFVYDPRSSTVRKTAVRCSGSEEKNAIVHDGLEAGDIISVAGVSFLADGMKVKLMEKRNR